MKRFFFLVFLISIFFSCKKESPNEAALRTLREADRSWCKSVTDFEGFMSFLDDEVVWYFCNSPSLNGKNSVRSFFKKMYENPTSPFTWTPDRVVVSISGDMGYTYGTYKFIPTGSSEQQTEEIHNYATIWRKQMNGTWKVILEADF